MALSTHQSLFPKVLFTILLHLHDVQAWTSASSQDGELGGHRALACGGLSFLSPGVSPAFLLRGSFGFLRKPHSKGTLTRTGRGVFLPARAGVAAKEKSGTRFLPARIIF